MFIEFQHPLVQSFLSRWNRAESTPSEERSLLAQKLQHEFVTELIRLAQSFVGQLILLHHEFLTMEPTGEHSFAHGSSMGSKTVYWTHVARLSQSLEHQFLDVFE